MKQIIFICLMVAPFIGSSQSIDSLNRKYEELQKRTAYLERDLGYVKHNLREHTKEFNTGLVFSIIGLGITGIGIYKQSTEAAVVGGVFTLSGTAIMWASHRFFKIAARRI